MALIGDVVPEERRQASIGRVMGMMFLVGASATLVGGFLAQFGSWRFVYIFYGIAELTLAFVILRVLPKQAIHKKQINIRSLYATALRNRPLVGTALTILLVGFAVFGTAVNGRLFQATGSYAVAFVAGASTLLILAIISPRKPSVPGIIPARPADA